MQNAMHSCGISAQELAMRCNSKRSVINELLYAAGPLVSYGSILRESVSSVLNRTEFELFGHRGTVKRTTLLAQVMADTGYVHKDIAIALNCHVDAVNSWAAGVKSCPRKYRAQLVDFFARSESALFERPPRLGAYRTRLQQVFETSVCGRIRDFARIVPCGASYFKVICSARITHSGRPACVGLQLRKRIAYLLNKPVSYLFDKNGYARPYTPAAAGEGVPDGETI